MVRSHRRRTASPSLGIPSWGVAVCSLLSVVLLKGSVHVPVGHESPLTPRLPYILAFTAAISGFPGFAVLFAILGALPWLFLSGLGIVFGGGVETRVWLLLLSQIALVIFAVADVVAGVRGKWPRIETIRRLLGLVCGVLVYLLANTLL
jgi:hypothetical protein